MDEQEKAITKLIAQQCKFEEHGSFWVCQVCGKRLKAVYLGKAINERMLDHAAHHGIVSQSYH